MSAPSVRSFDPSPEGTVTTPAGASVHGLLADHSDRLTRNFYAPLPGVWCFVGNGLSNQTFVEGPEGVIAIDTGESVEEMRAALKHLAGVCDRPVVAVMYTHFHYVGGTRAVLETFGADIPIYAHDRVVTNLKRVSDDIAPMYGRGLVEQFGLVLPAKGPDSMPNVGLGLTFRLAEHAPHTQGFVAPTITTDRSTVWKIAGLDVQVTPAPSDADDSVTIWFPALKTAVQNLVWPALFNVFPIRGEEYRDPRVLLQGLDDLLALGAQHLLGAHGPPISGAAEIATRVRAYRDAIQFLWDQTVRGMNKGWTTDELAARVRLPQTCDTDYITSERYGVTEHHVRQIHNGLKGWFDGDPAKLFPLEPAERASRLIEGFGGRSVVRAQAVAAMQKDDLRWAIELASWLVAAPANTAEELQPDRNLLADALRLVGQRTPAANIRSWALTRARDLEGVGPLARYRTHRFRRDSILADPIPSVATLRVLLDPDRADGLDAHVRFDFGSDRACGLHVRNNVAVPTDGSSALISLRIDPGLWAEFLTGKKRPADLVADNPDAVAGNKEDLLAMLACFDISAPR
jgi:alkyl sulfatase BDS1-like metallo-beta-lactamase superfamily hydrolase